MKTKIGVLIFVSMLCIVCGSQATTWTSGHYVIDSSNLYGGVVDMYNDSSADMYSGYMDTISAYDKSLINLHDGHIAELRTYENSKANILGGEVTSIIAVGSCVIDFYDGTITHGVSIRENSVANIYGGHFLSFFGAGSAGSNSIVNLYAYDVLHTTTGGIYGFGQVTGKYLLDNSPFVLELANDKTFSHINIVPEPITMLLFVVGGLVLRIK
jgi:hypothetical protein